VLCTPPQCPQRTPKTLASADAFAAPFADKPSTSGVLVSGAWNVPFAPGSAQLDAAALQIIKQVGPELSDRGRLTIIGRTDVNSPDSVTPVPVLAVLRAHAVRDSLKQIRPDLAEAMQIRAEEVPVGAVRRTEIVFESIPSPP
jgi:flagellar motor protein MotB